MGMLLVNNYSAVQCQFISTYILWNTIYTEIHNDVYM